MSTPRTYRLLISYDGGAYHGWQIQSRLSSIQGELNRALSTMCNRPMKSAGASRTDAGVHAEGQVASFSYGGHLTAHDFSRGLNGLLPRDIAVRRVEEIEGGFHARHSARGKIYLYQLWNARERNPFVWRYSWWLRGSLDLERMQSAAQGLVGEHDFAAMRAADCSAETTVRRMHAVSVVSRGPLVQIVVSGSGFLKQMVRVMVGTLVDIGQRRLSDESIPDILMSRDRSRAGQTAPAQGLILRQVIYPRHPWSSPLDTDQF